MAVVEKTLGGASGSSTASAGPLTARLLAEVLGDAHRYSPGLEPHRPTVVAARPPLSRRAVTAVRDRTRDRLERIAARAGFSHRHFDPERGAAALQRIVALSGALEATYARLGDERSRRAMVEVLKLRVLGPCHAPLRITPEAYRARQRYADQELRLQPDTFAVSDPWFSPLSLYRVPVADGPAVTLHSHSVDVVSVFLLEQYGYGETVRARPGDVVLDVGGCWGDTALYFAARVGPAGKVYTFEFDPESLAIMRANLALNPELAGRIEIVERALWDRSDEVLEIAQAGRMTTVGRANGGGPALQAPTVTVDDFVREADLDRVDLIKMDVEGAEPWVLAGAADTLAGVRPRLAMAAYHRDDDLARLPAALDTEYRLYLESYSPLEDETVLFASPVKSST